MKDLYLYSNGLPFSEELRTALRYQIKRVHIRRLASLIIIDGGLGQGKTTLAVEIVDFINSEFNLPPLVINKDCHQYSYGCNEFSFKLPECSEKGLPCLIFDEAGDFNSRGALTRTNKEINRIFETYRSMKVIVIICLPSFLVLDRSIFLKNIPRLLIHCYGKKENYGNFNVYNLYRMFYIKEKLEKLTVPAFAYSLTRPNFHGKFKNLPPDRENQLNNYGTRKKRDGAFKSAITLDGLISTQDLIKKLGTTEVTFHRVRKLANLQAIRYYKNKKYYPEGAFELLRPLIEGRITKL